MSQISAVPTTVFVDQNGMILDKVVVGAYVDEYKKTLNYYLEN